MDERNRQVGWSEAQWNLLRQTISDEAARARVAGGFLPIYGPLPRGTEVVPTEWLNEDDWTVDSVSTAPLIEISSPLQLSGTQVQEEGLSSALELFGRVASVLTRLEDWTIFNGRDRLYGNPRRRPSDIPSRFTTTGGEQPYSSEDALPKAFPYRQDDRISTRTRDVRWTENLEDRMRLRLLVHNPGALGLIAGAALQVPEDEQDAPELDWRTLFDSIIDGLTRLESRGHPGPFYCILSNEAFRVANSPLADSLVLPRDRIEPFLGRELLRTSVIDDRQWEPGRPVYRVPEHDQPPDRPATVRLVQGVLLSLVGESMDLAVAADPTPEFLSVDGDGKYHFRIFERFALRIKQPDAIVRLVFQASRRAGAPAARVVGGGRAPAAQAIDEGVSREAEVRSEPRDAEPSDGS